MKLKELIDIFDKDRDTISIQICLENDWEEYDSIRSDSPIIRSLEDKTIKTAGAIAEDVIRVDIIWD